MTSKARNIADLGSNDVIETTATGVDVTGTITADGLTVDLPSNTGSMLFYGGSQSDRGLEISVDNSSGFDNSTWSLTSKALNNGSAITFGTRNTEHMRIDHVGNVGIGTASPNISGFSRALTIDSSESGIELSSSGTVNTLIASNAQGANIQGIGSSGIRLFTSASGSAAERARIDSSGNLLVGRTEAHNFGSQNSSGIEISGATDYIAVACAGVPFYSKRISTDGDLAQFWKDTTKVGSIGTAGGRPFFASNSRGLIFVGTGAVPCTTAGAYEDNIQDLGRADGRFDDVYATNGTIQTSDRNEKQDIEVLNEAEQRVAQACKGLLRKFRWQDAVEEKGDEARIHFGIIAQDLQDAFTAEGLDAGRYAMFISSTWTDEETGEERTRLGVRYPELLAFIISAI